MCRRTVKRFSRAWKIFPCDEKSKNSEKEKKDTHEQNQPNLGDDRTGEEEKFSDSDFLFIDFFIFLPFHSLDCWRLSVVYNSHGKASVNRLSSFCVVFVIAADWNWIQWIIQKIVMCHRISWDFPVADLLLLTWSNLETKVLLLSFFHRGRSTIIWNWWVESWVSAGKIPWGIKFSCHETTCVQNFCCCINQILHLNSTSSPSSTTTIEAFTSLNLNTKRFATY